MKKIIISKVKDDAIIGEIKEVNSLWYNPIKKDYRVCCGDIECPNNCNYNCKKCIFEYGDIYYLKNLIINRGL